KSDLWTATILAILQANNGDIIGVHIYNVFDLRTKAVQSHSYLLNFPDTKVFEIKKDGADQVMSMEYLLVNPKYRGKQDGFSWGEVVIGLGFNALLSSPWGGAVGIA